MKKYIVITTINEPSEAVRAFAANPEYKLVVVGDAKTPANWQCDNVEFISVAQQDSSDCVLQKYIPYNHYCRKMFGYLHAIRDGADMIVDTDDDNIPKEDWTFPDFEQEYDCVDDDLGFINVYELYTRQKIWPRGLPLKQIAKSTVRLENVSRKSAHVGVWQALADEDPDVDAIYRLTSNEACLFEEKPPYVLGKNTISPFNSQNTAIRKDLFALLYLPMFVTFRFTDILRGLVAQPIMWASGFHLGFLGATVVQKRNPHDYSKDFESEVPMYLHSERTVEIVGDAVSADSSVEDNLHKAYHALHKMGIVCDRELEALETWLHDYQQYL